MVMVMTKGKGTLDQKKGIKRTRPRQQFSLLSFSFFFSFTLSPFPFSLFFLALCFAIDSIKLDFSLLYIYIQQQFFNLRQANNQKKKEKKDPRIKVIKTQLAARYRTMRPWLH